MSHISKEEYLSAFVDGEAGSFEQHRICDQLVTDDEMRDKLSNFSLIGEAIRNRSQTETVIASPSFLSGIQDAIADEDPITSIEDSTVISLETVKAKKRAALPKQAFGYAVAASVAAVAAISFQNYSSTNTEKAPQMATASVEADSSSKKIQVSTVIPEVSPVKEKRTKVATMDDYFIATSFKAPDAEMRDLMDKYVAHHLQYASSRTLMPRVRAVSYSTDF